MPPAIIAALIGAGVSGTEVGLQASGALTPSTSGATKDAALLQAEQQQKAQQTQQQELFKGAAPNAQAQAPGLDASSMSALIAELSGSPGDVGQAQQTIFGNNPGGGSGGTGLSSSSVTGG